MTIVLLFLLAFASFDIAHASDNKTERTPVSFLLDPAILRDLTDEQRADVATIVELAEKRLFEWKNYGFPPLPDTFFSADDPAVFELKSFFKEPDSEDLAKLATGPGQLTPAQLNDIRAEGVFRVKSKEFPGQYHVWKVHSWLQEGINNIEIRLYKNRDNGLYQFGIALPKRLFDSKARWTLASSVRGIYRGIEEMADLFVGLKTNAPVYSNEQIERILIEERNETVQKYASENTLLETRLLDPQILKNAFPILSKIESSLPNNATNSDLRDALLQSKELENISPGLGAAFAARVRTLELLADAESQLNSEIQAWSEREAKRLRDRHPVQSRDPEWLVGQLVKLYAQGRGATPADLLFKVSDQLDAEGLVKEGYMLRLLFPQTVIAANRSAELAAHVKPARTFEFREPLLLSENWEVKNIDGRFYLKTFKTRTVHSGKSFWRIRNVVARSIFWTKKAIEFLVIRNIVNGVFGVKSLFKKKSFSPHWDVDQSTGKKVRVGERETMRSRITSFFKRRREILEIHRTSTETGFLGKTADRVALVLKADVGYGFLAPLTVAVGQPIVTALNIGASAGLAVASAPASAGLALLKTAKDAFISDTDAATDRGAFPLPRALGKVGLHGTVGLGGTAVGAAREAATGTWNLTGGLVGPLAAKARDRALFPVIRSKGRVPPKSGLLAKRIAGPGISSKYAYQVSPEIVLLALWAHMEQTALDQYQDRVNQEIEEPTRAFERFEKAFRVVFSGGNQAAQIFHNSTVAWRIRHSVRTYQKDLEKHVWDRREMLGRMTTVPHEIPILLSSRDLSPTIDAAASLSRRFYEDEMMDWTEDEKSRFWSERSLIREDWHALASMELKQVFGEAILTSVENYEKDYSLPVKTPSAVLALVENLHKDFSIQGFRAERPLLVAPAPTVLVTARTLCTDLLLNSAWGMGSELKVPNLIKKVTLNR